MRPFVSFFLILASCAGGPATAPPRPLRDFRGIIHCHSLYSHDSKGTYDEILAAAKAAKVDFVCMTDHPPKGDPGKSLREGWTGIHDGVLFIQGAEYSDQILALGIKEPIQHQDRRGKIRAIHEQGGVAIACHPEEIQDWSEYEEADGMEIYNVHAALKKHQKDPAFMAAALKTLKENPERSFELLHELDPAILAQWDEINRKRPFTGIAGNDAHQNVNVFGLQLDPYPRAFRHVATHVWAEELTQESVLRALREGRCYVEFMGAAGPSEEGRRQFRVGQSRRADGRSVLEVNHPVWDSVTYLKVCRNGLEIARGDGEGDFVTGRYALEGEGAYRVEWGQIPRPFLLSNHFRLSPERP